jgi:hypothetical protein
MDWGDAENARIVVYGKISLLQSAMMKDIMPADEWDAHLKAAEEAKAQFMQLVFNEIMRINAQLEKVRQ